LPIFFVPLRSEFDLSGKGPTVFRYSIKLPQTTISVINEGCQLTPYRGVSIGGIRQYHAGCGNPDGIELFIKSASRLFFQKLMNMTEALLDIFEMNMSNHHKDSRPPPD